MKIHRFPLLFGALFASLLSCTGDFVVSSPQQWINDKFQSELLKPHGTLLVYLPTSVFEGKSPNSITVELDLKSIEGRTKRTASPLRTRLAFLPQSENILYFPVPIGSYLVDFRVGYSIGSVGSGSLSGSSDDSLREKFSITVSEGDRFVIRPEFETTEANIPFNISFAILSPILFLFGNYPVYDRTHQFVLEGLSKPKDETRDFLVLGEVYEVKDRQVKLRTKPGLLGHGQTVEILTLENRSLGQAIVTLNFHAYSEAKLITSIPRSNGLKYGVKIKK